MNLESALERLTLLYGTGTPYHPGKWRVVERLARRHEGKVRVRRQGLEWELNLSCSIQRSLYYLGVFERRETRWLKSFVKPGMVVADVGANFGYYTVLASSLGAQVHAFEPLESNCALIRRNLELNNLSTALHRLALSDSEGEVKFGVPPPSCSGVGYICPPNGPRHRGLTVERVPAATLDSFELPRLDLLKVDIEGAETMALRGASRCLERFRPVIFAEVFPEGLRALGSSPDELLSLIRSHAYEVRAFTPTGPHALQSYEIEDHVNVVCTPC